MDGLPEVLALLRAAAGHVMPPCAPVFWSAVLLLSTPHWLYAHIWTSPKAFKAVARSISPDTHPVNFMASLAQVIKIFQLCVLALWALESGAVGVCGDHPTLLLGVGAVLVAAGQFLNASIYRAIGVDGVYYGVRLGKKVPWCTTFPFTVFQHPQYVGAAVTILGLFCLGLTAASAQNGILPLALAWVSMYLVTGYIEDNL